MSHKILRGWVCVSDSDNCSVDVKKRYHSLEYLGVFPAISSGVPYVRVCVVPYSHLVGDW